MQLDSLRSIVEDGGHVGAEEDQSDVEEADDEAGLKRIE